MAELNIVPVNVLETRIAGIIWGDAKTGKTTWAMSLPGRKLHINFDPDGFLSIAHRDDVDVLDLSIYNPTEAIEQAKKAAAHIKANGDRYQSIVVDSLTTLTGLAMHDAVSRNVGGGRTFTATIDAPGLAAYGARNNTVVDIIDRILRASGANKQNCFFIAHADDPEYSEDGKVILQQTIMLSSKIKNNSALRVSEIYYLELASQNRRFVYLAPYGIKKPMGSRIFDTVKVPKFELKYDVYRPDEEQKDSLTSIVTKYRETKMKLVKGPNE